MAIGRPRGTAGRKRRATAEYDLPDNPRLAVMRLGQVVTTRTVPAEDGPAGAARVPGYSTVMVILSDTTGGSCGTWL